MDAGESLAKGSCRNGHLRDHLRTDQRATAKDPSLDPARRCFAWSGLDGLHRRHDSGARVSRGQLRYAGPVARDDADIGVPLSRALFEWAADVVLNFSRTPQRLLLYLTLTSGI